MLVFARVVLWAVAIVAPGGFLLLPLLVGKRALFRARPKRDAQASVPTGALVPFTPVVTGPVPTARELPACDTN